MKHFRRSEFACKCGCGMDTVDYELAGILEDLREHFGLPVYITSGNRCFRHNVAVDGRQKSKHLISQAADVVVKNTNPIYVYAYLANRYPLKHGIGSYGDFTHIDIRPDKARW